MLEQSHCSQKMIKNNDLKKHKNPQNYFGPFIPLPYVKRGQTNTLTSATHTHNS